MAEASDKESKTEHATEKKVRDALDQGKVPVSKEATTLAGLLALIAALGLLSADRAASLSHVLIGFIANSNAWRLENSADISSLSLSVGSSVLLFVGPIVLIFMIFGSAASLLQVGAKLLPEKLIPRLSRISVAEGWKRLTNSAARVEFVRTLVRFLALACIGGIVVRSIYVECASSLLMDPAAMLALAQSSALRIVIVMAVISLVLMAADLPLAHLFWQKELRMTRQEVKDEYKQQEGDPAFKSRRRSIFMTRARRSMMSRVPKATVVIANPTHFAVALRYSLQEGGAPRVVAKGQDFIALAIRRLAEEHNVPVVEDKGLARSLYDCVEVDQMIPVEFYRAVAEILTLLNSRKRVSIVHA